MSDLVPLRFPAPRVEDGALETTVLFVDSFGNLRLAGLPEDLAAALGPLTPGRQLVAEFPASGKAASVTVSLPWVRTFGERPLGAPLLYQNSFGHLALADNQGNAARRLGIDVDRAVRIRPA